MIRAIPTEAVLTAIVATLQGTSAVTTLATGGVYNNVPAGTPFPYVEVTAPADRRLDTMGRFGAETVVNVKAVSQAFGDREASRILAACTQALNFASLSLTSPQASLGITWDNSDRYAEVINGVTTRHHVGIFRVWTEQTS